MEAITTNYIPREWFALKINACKMAIEHLPNATVSLRKIRGIDTPVCTYKHHRYTMKNKPIYPDFVIYIKELDCCKIHEHFGMMNSSTYLRITKSKYDLYTDAGLVPDLDILFTYDISDMPFDVRTLWPRINSLVYCSLFAK